MHRARTRAPLTSSGQCYGKTQQVFHKVTTSPSIQQKPVPLQLEVGNEHEHSPSPWGRSNHSMALSLRWKRFLTTTVIHWNCDHSSTNQLWRAYLISYCLIISWFLQICRHQHCVRFDRNQRACKSHLNWQSISSWAALFGLWSDCSEEDTFMKIHENPVCQTVKISYQQLDISRCCSRQDAVFALALVPRRCC